MKNFFLTGLLLFISFLTFGQANAPAEAKNEENVAVISFDIKEHDFGDLKQGDIVEHTVEFKNTGKTPLILAGVQTTCGCTATKWSQLPILPDKVGSITVQFNTAGKQGIQNKVVTIKSNATNQIERVIIKANIITR
jgi:hypothetical protein